MRDILALIITIIIIVSIVEADDIEASILEEAREKCVEGTITTRIGWFFPSYECKLKENI